MVVVYTSGRQDTEENILLGIDFTSKDWYEQFSDHSIYELCLCSYRKKQAWWEISLLTELSFNIENVNLDFIVKMSFESFLV